MTMTNEICIPTRNELIAQWYLEVFPNVATYVKRNGGDLDTAREIFQEALVLYYEKTCHLNFNPENSDEAYLMGISKNLWLKHYSRQKSFESLSEMEWIEEKAKEPIPQKILNYLTLTGEKCMNLLQAFYYEKLDMAQLAERFGYTSVRSTTVQKYKCLEKVRNQIKSRSLSYEDFLN